MAYTIQQSVNYAQPYFQYMPMTAGANNEPAMSIADMIQTTVTNAPFTWGWNRNEQSFTLTAGTSDYTQAWTDFGFIEKVSLTYPTPQQLPNPTTFELKDVYNTNAIAVTSLQQKPNAVCVKAVNYGTNVSFRFQAVPDQNYTATVTYQKFIPALASLTSDWALPDNFKDVYNNMMLAEFLAVSDDARVTYYRQRAAAALLSKAEGLTEMQRNAFLAQYLSRTSMQEQTAQLKVTQGNQARAV